MYLCSKFAIKLKQLNWVKVIQILHFPITEEVNQIFALSGSFFPFALLIKTEPPMPKRSPTQQKKVQSGDKIAKAAVPFGPAYWPTQIISTTV